MNLSVIGVIHSISFIIFYLDKYFQEVIWSLLQNQIYVSYYVNVCPVFFLLDLTLMIIWLILWHIQDTGYIESLNSQSASLLAGEHLLHQPRGTYPAGGSVIPALSAMSGA